MFITKRHIPRRTFLRGAGVTLALPLLEAMIPATHTAGADGGGAQAAVHGHLLSARHGAGLLDARRPRARCPTQLPYILESLKKRPGADRAPERPVVEVGRTTRGNDRIGSLGGRGVPDGDQAAQDRRLRRQRRQRDDRPADRAEDRTGNAAAVAADGLRGSEFELEQLRRRLQLLVYEFDFVGRAADAAAGPRDADQSAADGAQSAGRVRAAVRERRDAGSACGAHEAEPQHPRLGAGRAGQPVEGARTVGRAHASTSTPTRSARSNVVSSLPPRLRATCRRSTCRSGVPEQFDQHIKFHFDLTALAFKADITRVATLLGARDLTGRVVSVPEERALPGRRQQRQLPRRLAPPGRSAERAAVRGAQPVSRLDARLLRREAAVVSRTATARCSIGR